MKVNTTRFGQVELERERVITFARGLLGFPDNHDYVLLQTNAEGNFFWLQSVDRPELAFVVCDPLLFVPDYQVNVKSEDFREVGLTDMTLAQVLIIVNKVDRTLTGNLQGPLLINAANRQARQLVLSEKKYSTRHPLIELTVKKDQANKTA